MVGKVVGGAVLGMVEQWYSRGMIGILLGAAVGMVMVKEVGAVGMV